MLWTRLEHVIRGLRQGAEPGQTVSVPICEQLEERLLLSLLGIGEQIELPNVFYDANGSATYQAAAESFDVDAAPMAVFLPGSPPSPVFPPSDFQLHIRIDNAGNLIGGVEGPDLVVDGQFTDMITGQTYFGPLLMGEIVAFGHNDSGTETDQYDFRLTPTDGSLMPFFQGKDVGVHMTSIQSTFAGIFTEDFAGKSQGTLGPIEPLPAPEPSSLAGKVYVDANNNGVDDGEQGIAGVEVTLSGAEGSVTKVTPEDGSYVFDELASGTYTLTEAQNIDYLDGDDAAGDAGGLVGDDVISEIVLAGGENATGYNFGELVAASLSGLVYEDFNNDGEINFGETAIENVAVTLTGIDDRGNDVTASLQTDLDGVYFFTDLRPSDLAGYTIAETQPEGYQDGLDTLGDAGGTAGNDVFSEISLDVAQDGMNYNFGERPEAGTQIASGQTATIGFWQNKHGQNLIKALNGGVSATQLGDWLAATFPNMFGDSAGDSNLDGKDNQEIASLYREAFKAKKGKTQSNLTARKLECQVMATAFATYCTNLTLAGNTAEQYGFLVTEHGLGIAIINVGSSGAAFGVEDGTELTVMEILAATNEQAIDGVLYNMDNLLRSLANQVYTMINESGDI